MDCQKTFSLVGGLVLAIIAGMSFATPAAAAFSLVWSDEFDGTSLNTADWTIDIGDGCPDLCGWGNNELQYYRAENVEVSGGNLILTARDQYYGGRYFTSGKVHTRDKRSFLYGRIEMRAKIPTGGGMWPAFWMMPQDDAYGGWAASGEIDIMESVNATTSIGGTIHFGGSYPDNTYSSGSYSPGGINFADEFHVYAVEWEPDEIRWYVDDALFSTKTSSQWYSDGAPGDPNAPFDQDFYIIMNAAVGGNMTGCTSTSCVTADLPQQYLIDYVRVYQETGNLAPTVAVTYPTEGDNPPAGDITIEAAASDTDGAVAKVEFYEDLTYLGEDTTAPYTLLWPSVPSGCYTISARAIDDEGAYSIDAADVTVGAGCGQAPYLGVPFALPTRIEAEDYDDGGEAVAYHDLDAGNQGSAYRTSEDVDVQSCSDAGGGYNVGWLREGEWLEYTVDVPGAGEYEIDVRVASYSAGGEFRIEFDGVDKTGAVTVPVTGGWQTWTTVSTTATLEPGVQVMRFIPTVEGFNLNYIEFRAPTAVAAPSPPRAFALHPNTPNPFNPSTTIAYDLARPSAVDLAVYDVAGRKVRTLVSAGNLSAGRHEVVWNGRGDDGRDVASGVYFCRLLAGGYSETRRLLLLR
ncbi:MAG: family 16 glycosylhydrolase [Candidatus Eisenbacteria bacterium]|nr:family 16 glycosylhydrolase [Candidatus Eisenbacteria bacterium]